MNTGYNEGHPWYYVLGGPIPFPSEIREAARRSGYKGWRERYIRRMDLLSEPLRSTALHALRQEVVDEYRRDISVYRGCANALRRHRREYPGSSEDPVCDDVHTSMGLKYCHLFNAFAHLCVLDALLTRQPDLFG
jgi:hypothetical protein